jgi:hypothetical protein
MLVQLRGHNTLQSGIDMEVSGQIHAPAALPPEKELRFSL